MRLIHFIPVVLLLLAFSVAAEERFITESAREIPVAYEVDVAVVGGSTGAVTAAVEAACAGARVFLAAPRPYLGEDVCGTYRLWLEPDEVPETPLAKRMFEEPPAPEMIVAGVPFTYETDRPYASMHKDTTPPSLLGNERWKDAYKDSIQYDGDVAITLDLGEEVELGKIQVLAFHRNNDIELARVKVFLSADKEHWRDGPVIENDCLGKKDYIDSAFLLAAPLTGKARYLRVVAEKTERVDRLLLAEIIVASAEAVAKAPEPEEASVRIPPPPMQIKRALDDALLDAGVSFLYGCFVTDVLRDEDGALSGFVMANRSGRQAVLAKTIIDATPRATVARMAGVPFKTVPAGTQTFQRVVVGGDAVAGVDAKPAPSPVQTQLTGGMDQVRQNATFYTITLDMPDLSFRSFAEAEHLARDKTWTPELIAASEYLFQVPPDPMEARAELADAWPGAAAINLDVFRPVNEDALFVLGACADISREAAAKLLRPLAYMDVGTRIGKATQELCTTRSFPSGKIWVATQQKPYAVTGEVWDSVGWVMRGEDNAKTISSPEHALPVLGEYDVVVVGGGTGGAPAGIAAARQGAKTLVIEYQYGLGGVGTLGLIGKYYHGYRGGFTAEIDRGVGELGGLNGPVKGGWNVEWKMEWYRRALREAGAEIWFGVLGCGTVVDGDQVKGVVVATPEGRGVVLAKTVIDATGNADVAAAAGAPCFYTDASHVAVQGTGMPPRTPGDEYNNTDYTITDDSDVLDQWRTFVAGRRKYEKAYDMGQFIDTRERRRIVGDFIISPLDIWNQRTYPDSVVLASSNFDTHGYTVHPLFALRFPDKDEWRAFMPLRSLTPQGLKGILVTGLGVSAHRDSMPILRMQPDIQNQGYAAGLIAAQAAKANCDVRDVDIKAIQRVLVDMDNLPESVLTDTDSYPLPEKHIAEAVKALSQGYDSVAAVLSQPETSLPLLRKIYKNAEPPSTRLVYAHVLAMMGDDTGTDDLLKVVAENPWDEGWSFTGGGQFGGSLSPMDSYIIALGKTGSHRALEALGKKIAQLDASSAFSHHRAVAMALETLQVPEGAPLLTALLEKPEMQGHDIPDIRKAEERAAFGNPNQSRDQSLRELILARALYRCGDQNGLGKRILRNYAKDFRGHLARHAQAILAQ